MRTSVLRIVIIAAIPVFGTGCSEQADNQVSFKNDVQPIMNAKCIECHIDGEGTAKSGFSVRTYDTLMKGTKFGPVVVPGDSVSSTLFRLVGHEADPEIQMPPHHDESLASGKVEALTGAEIATIKTWIDQGAKNN